MRLRVVLTMDHGWRYGITVFSSLCVMQFYGVLQHTSSIGSSRGCHFQQACNIFAVMRSIVSLAKICPFNLVTGTIPPAVVVMRNSLAIFLFIIFGIGATLKWIGQTINNNRENIPRFLYITLNRPEKSYRIVKLQKYDSS